MKAFMKLIITIIVVAVIGFIVGFLFMNGAKTNEELQVKESGDTLHENLESGNASNDKVEIIASDSGNVLNSGEEQSGENGDVSISKEEKIRSIDNKVREIVNSEDEVNRVIDKLSLDLVSDMAKDFMKYFKQDKLSVAVNAKPGLIEIIPDVDFVENMVYYFDENGNLILYESVSTTVGGSCKYYFDNGKGIGVRANYEEDVKYKEEYIGDVLNRARLIYDKYAIIK